MKHLSLMLLAFAIFACTPAPDPIEQAFADYIKPLMNDPDSYEFVSVDLVKQYHVTYPDYMEGLRAAKRNGIAKDSMWAITTGPEGYADIWATYRGRNKLGGVVTTQIYFQYENQKVISGKEWKGPMPGEPGY